MDHAKAKISQRLRRKHRVRRALRGTPDRPRLSVSRSHQHIYCQLIDDAAGKTLCAASTREPELRQQVGYGGNCQAATLIGTVIAQRAKQLGITRMCFDRGAYKYHGRVAALADAAREQGIEF